MGRVVAPTTAEAHNAMNVTPKLYGASPIGGRSTKIILFYTFNDIKELV
jgi:hypothetical protein